MTLKEFKNLTGDEILRFTRQHKWAHMYYGDHKILVIYNGGLKKPKKFTAKEFIKMNKEEINRLANLDGGSDRGEIEMISISESPDFRYSWCSKGGKKYANSWLVSYKDVCIVKS